MPRRPPPSSLRLHKGPVPSRGEAKHTLPSVPRPVVIPNDVSRSTSSRGAPHSRQASVASSHSSSSSSSYSIYSTPEKDVKNSWSRPHRRSTERTLETSGLGLPPLPKSSSPSAPAPNLSRRGSSVNSSLVSTPVSSGSATQSQQNEALEQREQSQPRRGPWDHSRAVSLPFDVGSVLALPKPAAVSP